MTITEPKQSRGIETRRLILTHAEHHLRRVGVRQFSTSVVAHNAGVSVGIIYRYFADSEALIEAVYPGACRPWTLTTASPEGATEVRYYLSTPGALDQTDRVYECRELTMPDGSQRREYLDRGQSSHGGVWVEFERMTP